GIIDRIDWQLQPGDPGRMDDLTLLAHIADAQGALSNFLSEGAMPDAGTAERAERLSARLQGLRSERERRVRRARLEDAITAAVAYVPEGRGPTRLGELAPALHAYAKEFPDVPRSRAFTEVVRDQPIWDAIAEWDRITARWRAGAENVAAPEAAVR